MKPAQILKQKVASGSLTLGAFAGLHLWPGLIEVSMRAALDYLIIDLEHFTHGHENVADMCAIARMLDFPVLIRPPAADLNQLRLAADLGPCGIVIPYVETTADLDLVQDAIYLKPRGKRRPGGPGNRWLTGFNYEDWKTQVEDDFIVLPQIESKAGLANVDAIARHPITTSMAIGPYDLSADLGICWQPNHPTLVDAQKKIRAAARSAGKVMWAIGDPQQLIKWGFTFLCIETDPVGLMENTLAQITAQARASVRPPDRSD